MLKITNGVNVFEVTKGAFDGIYARQGYRPVKEKTEAQKQEVTKESEASEDERFVTDIAEKPISQWSKEEVKRYAELKGVDISGTKNVNEAKDRIKQAMANEQ